MARVTVREAPPVGPDFTDRLVFACFILSGALGLVCVVSWIAKATLLFGEGGAAFQAVLATFLAGLGLGSYVYGRRVRTTNRPLESFAKLQFFLGAFVLLTPALFGLAGGIYGAMYPGLYESSVTRMLLQLCMSAIAVLPAGFAIGGMLPLVCRQYLVQQGTLARSVGFFYGSNTVGAGIGCLVASYLLLPAFGTSTTLYIAGALCLAVGFVVHSFADDRRAPLEGVASRPDEDSAALRDRRVVGSMFFLGGGVLCANLLLGARFLSLLTSPSGHTQALFLGIVLVGVGAGAWLTAKRFDDTEARAFAFGGVQVLSGLFMLFMLFLPAAFWRENLVNRDGEAGMQAFALVLLVPAFFAGISFPLAVRMVVGVPRLAATQVGGMRALYALGGALGTLLVGSFLLPTFGLEAGVRYAGATSVLCGVGIWLSVDGAKGRSQKLFLGTAALAALFVMPGYLGAQLPLDFLQREGDRVVAIHEGRHGSIAVLERGGVRRLELDRRWQGEDRKNHQVMAAHVPMLVHPDPKDVMAIGLGVGQTARRFLDYEIERLDCVAATEGLEQIVRENFESKWMDDSRVHVTSGSGRNVLRNADQDYDVISISVGQTAHPGMGAYYTLDFYEEAQTALREGGLICQYLPMTLFDTGECASVIRTFLEAFPSASLWYNAGQLLLLGTHAAPFRISAERLEQMLAQPAQREDLRWSHWGGIRERLGTPTGFLGSFLMGQDGLRELSAGAVPYRDEPPLFDAEIAEGPDPRAEVLIAELISKYTPPATDFLDDAKGFTRTEENRIEELRRANLADLGSASMGRAGYQAFINEEYGEARDLLRRALRANSRNVPLRIYLGDVHEALGQHSDAMREYQTAQGVDPERIATHERLAAGYEVDQRDDLALRHYKSLYELQRDDFGAALAYGRALFEVDNALKAIEILEPHAAQDDAELHFQLGRAYNGRRDREKTRLAYLRCLELDETRVEARVNLGNLYRDLGQTSEAIQEYEQAIRTRPTLVIAHYNLSVTLSREERIDEAIEAGKRLLQLKDDFHPMYDHLGTMYYRKGSYRQAVQMYERALEIKPDFSNALTNLERAKAKLGS